MNHYWEGDSAWEAGMEFPSLHTGSGGAGGRWQAWQGWHHPFMSRFLPSMLRAAKASRHCGYVSEQNNDPCPCRRSIFLGRDRH